jgi:transposase-like protein
MAQVKVNETVFNAIKAMTQGGATIPDCAKAFGIAHATVSRVRAAKDFAEYHAPKKPEVKKEPETPNLPETNVVEHRQCVTVQATHYMETKLDKCIELLTGISAKLARIIDDLYGVK